MSKTLSKKRDPAMDFMRIIMMALIVNFHFKAGLSDTSSILYGYANGGWGSVGTCMFFMLSGYFLSLNHGGRTFSLRETFGFYKKHLPSLFVPFYLVYIVGFIITAIRKATPLFGGNPLWLILSVLGVDNYAAHLGYEVYYFGVGEWYSTIIILLYLLCPLILTLKEKSPLITGMTLFLLYGLNIALRPFDIQPDSGLPTGLFLFFLGMLFADYKDCILRARWLLIPSLAGALLVTFIRLPGYPDYSLPWKNLLGICLFIIFFLVFHMVLPEGREIRAISLLGQSMYCVYLTHHFILFSFFLDIIKEARGRGLFLLYLLYILVVLLCSLLFHLVSGVILKRLKAPKNHR